MGSSTSLKRSKQYQRVYGRHGGTDILQIRGISCGLALAPGEVISVVSPSEESPTGELKKEPVIGGMKQSPPNWAFYGDCCEIDNR